VVNDGTQTKHEKVVRVVRLKTAERGGQRLLEGTATSGALDRQGDILEPAGAGYKLPIPLLLDHDHSKVVGEVYELTPTKSEIRFKAKIFTFAESGIARDLCDFAWDAVRGKLRRAVSVGFIGDIREPIATGWRYLKWSILELSLVAIPANADAKIEAFKGYHPVVKVTMPPRRHLPPPPPDPAVLKRAELDRIKQRTKEIGKAIKKFEGLTRLVWRDQSAVDAYAAAVRDLQKEQAALRQREIGIHAGTIEVATPKETTTATKAAPRRPASWGVRGLPAPEVPADVFERSPEDHAKALEQHLERHVDGAFAIAQKAGLNPSSPATVKQMFRLQAEAAAMIGWAFRRLQHAEKRLAEVEAAGSRYRGVYQKADSYSRGDFATHDGSMWHANRQTSEIPGSGNDWSLAVKRGRDGKDAA
jgi:hypothetical protein